MRLYQKYCTDLKVMNKLKARKKFDKMMGNPLKKVDDLIKQAKELNIYCECGGYKLPESDFCKDCI